MTMNVKMILNANLMVTIGNFLILYLNNLHFIAVIFVNAINIGMVQSAKNVNVFTELANICLIAINM